MASGGGGSWKVAYADFVTAMMAFFMVMWICSQDQNTREAVAHYFNEPYQFFKDPVGSNRRPDKTGALFQGKSAGTVPDSEKVALGRGRESYSQGQPSRATRTVSEWINNNEKTAAYWRGKAVEALKTASRQSDGAGNNAVIEDAAAQVLGGQLKSELGGDAPPKKGDDLHNHLLGDVLTDVNWTEVAEDLLRHERFPDASPFP